MTTSIAVSTHACERYAERVMELGEDIKLNKDQEDAIRTKILKCFTEKFGRMEFYPNGKYTCADAEYVIKNGVIVTSTNIVSENIREFKGGVTHSGRKVKKTTKAGNENGGSQYRTTKRKIKTRMPKSAREA